jgi:(p)ppGpp synthase/HD superfamily hydrolase
VAKRLKRHAADHTSPSYTLTVRLLIPDRPGMFARIAQAIGRKGASLGAVDLVSAERGVKIRDVTLQARDVEHSKQVVKAVETAVGRAAIASGVARRKRSRNLTRW